MDDTTICDGCGCEIPRANANYAGPELPRWEGATLCADCWADEMDRARRRAVIPQGGNGHVATS